MEENVNATSDEGSEQSADLTLDQVYQAHKIEDDAAKYQRLQTEVQPIPTVRTPVQDDTGFLNELAQSHNSLAARLNAESAARTRDIVMKDVDSAVDTVANAVGQDKTLIKAHLNAKADEDPRFKKLFDMRYQNPKAWNDALQAVSNELQDKWAVKSDPDLLVNQRAMRAYQSGSAAQQTQSKQWENLSQAEFDRQWRNIS